MPKQSFFVLPEHTYEEKLGVVVFLSNRVVAGKVEKTKKAFSRLFGTELPHDNLESLLHLNSRALIAGLNQSIFRILTHSIPSDFYKEKSFIESHQERYTDIWKRGNILDRWEKHTLNPNPHHILPESRGGSNGKRNFWQMDRVTHDDFHLIFQNLTPIEQILMMLNIYRNLLSEDFTEALRNIVYIQYPGVEGYKSGVIRRDSKHMI